MIFGVFDGLHKGHLHFINQASKLGSIITVVTRNSIILKMKKHLPKFSLKKRISDLSVARTVLAIKIIAGDTKIGSWNVIKKNKPDIVALGYDQKDLKKSLKKFISENKLKIKIKIISPHKPKKFHSSILSKKTI